MWQDQLQVCERSNPYRAGFARVPDVGHKTEPLPRDRFNVEFIKGWRILQHRDINPAIQYSILPVTHLVVI